LIGSRSRNFLAFVSKWGFHFTPERIGQTSKDFKPKEKQCFQQTKMVKEKSRTVDREGF
jgi:hypothetical protein